ncbi:hypothetical protein Y1Q_0015637 [Alligator mississippiensis]|uniref:Uncharacterized protein n=1 Tax=Alligator mississippiensis TaxID=8496 RepID=A0A151NNM0_ALLMI|nr:hypothetical protein Y1Q_0015637 [Alligator mississippiensis]
MRRLPGSVKDWGILSSAISSEWNEPAQSYALMWFDSASYQDSSVPSPRRGISCWHLDLWYWQGLWF